MIIIYIYFFFFAKINLKTTIIIQSQVPEFFYEKKKYKFKSLYFTRIDEYLIENKILPNKVQIKKMKKLYYKDFISLNKIKQINFKLKEIAIRNNLKFINSENFFCNTIGLLICTHFFIR